MDLRVWLLDNLDFMQLSTIVIILHVINHYNLHIINLIQLANKGYYGLEKVLI